MRMPDMNNCAESGISALNFLDICKDETLMGILLADRTSHKNILWATDEYADLGNDYEPDHEIELSLISDQNMGLIRQRSQKDESSQLSRTRDKAEVFTPSWVCNKQNNLVDSQWFGHDNVFNTETGETWVPSPGNITFNGTGKIWTDYVYARRLEAACGEAPYLVSRYDTVTGKEIPLMSRIGIFDRKMRIVQENTDTVEEWLKWSQRAVESTYAYEYQGDNLLIARMNMLISYADYYYYRFRQDPSEELLEKIAKIISWNLWQMDGLKCVIPGSCKPVENSQMSLFDLLGDDDDSESNASECPGCKTGDVSRHTGIYCKIRNWRGNRVSETFLSMLRGGVRQ